ncbi:MAG: hypothetical protein ACR2NP_03110 [Pirellulaceae bacterium]
MFRKRSVIDSGLLSNKTWRVLPMMLLLFVGCRGPVEVGETELSDAEQPTVETEEERVAAMRQHFGNINLKAWPQIDSRSIGNLISGEKVRTIVGQPRIRAQQNSANSGWMWVWKDTNGVPACVQIEVINSGFAESDMILQAGSLQNGAARGDLESVDLSKYGVMAFWNSEHAADFLTICCRNQLLGVNTKSMSGDTEADRAERKRIAIALANELFESATHP